MDSMLGSVCWSTNCWEWKHIYLLLCMCICVYNALIIYILKPSMCKCVCIYAGTYVITVNFEIILKLTSADSRYNKSLCLCLPPILHFFVIQVFSWYPHAAGKAAPALTSPHFFVSSCQVLLHPTSLLPTERQRVGMQLHSVWNAHLYT